MTSEEVFANKKVVPTKGKADGGTYFDDEMQDEKVRRDILAREAARMLNHLQERPDHVIYVGSREDRGKLRLTLNHFRRNKLIDHAPTILIDYGIPEGGLRIDEDRR